MSGEIEQFRQITTGMPASLAERVERIRQRWELADQLQGRRRSVPASEVWRAIVLAGLPLVELGDNNPLGMPDAPAT